MSHEIASGREEWCASCGSEIADAVLPQNRLDLLRTQSLASFSSSQSSSSPPFSSPVSSSSPCSNEPPLTDDGEEKVEISRGSTENGGPETELFSDAQVPNILTPRGLLGVAAQNNGRTASLGVPDGNGQQEEMAQAPFDIRAYAPSNAQVRVLLCRLGRFLDSPILFSRVELDFVYTPM